MTTTRRDLLAGALTAAGGAVIPDFVQAQEQAHDHDHQAHHRLKRKLEQMLKAADMHPQLLPHSLYLGKGIPIGGTAHQAGMVRFGSGPRRSAPEVNCKAHDLDNLNVVDAGFFVSIGAVNPSLTIMAHALRVGDHLLQRMH